MSRKTDCLKHRNSWMERHFALSFLLIITAASMAGYWLVGNLFVGFGVGVLISVWAGLRCLAKEVYFATIHRVRGDNDVITLADD